MLTAIGDNALPEHLRAIPTKHIGAICDVGPSHVAAMASICRELQSRGHRTTLFRFPRVLDERPADGLHFFPLAVPDPGFTTEYGSALSRTEGVELKSFLKYMIARAHFVCEYGPEALQAAKVDCVLVDMADPAAASTAEKLGLPFVTIGNALPLHADRRMPPDFLPWFYQDNVWGQIRNSIAYGIRDVMISPLHRALNEYRCKWGLQPYKTPGDSFSGLAQVTQLVRQFDLPRTNLPECFHYVGPYQRATSGDSVKANFPYHRLDGRPLVYSSLGTIQGARKHIWQAIAESCAAADVQLVVALGKRGLAEQIGPLPGEPVIVDYTPQLDLLSRASLAILHGGLNSTLEALAAGVPMITVPLVGDQFGVAARVVYSGSGERLLPKECTPARLGTLIRKILSNHEYRQHATGLRAAIENTTGARGAADIIERIMLSGKPALRDHN